MYLKKNVKLFRYFNWSKNEGLKYSSIINNCIQHIIGESIEYNIINQLYNNLDEMTISMIL